MQFCNLCNRGDLNRPPRFLLLKSFPFAIGGFVDAVEFTPTAEKRVDTGRCNRLSLSRTKFDKIAGGELVRKEIMQLFIIFI